MYLRSSFFHATFQEDSDSHHPQKAFFLNLKQHPTVPNILSKTNLPLQRCCRVGPLERRLPRLRHELLSSAAPATRAVRVHRGAPGVVDAAAAGEGYGARSSQGYQGQSRGGVVRVVGWMMVGDMNP